MEYRKLPHGEERLSVLGLGTSSIGAAGDREIEAAMGMALEAGMNFFDMASADTAPFPAYGRAITGMRKKLYFQIHFGADYTSGKYGWTTDLDTIKRSIDWQLTALRTDYIDFGFLHCIDEESDLKLAIESGVLDYIQSLKAQGVVRHIALGSHTPRLANRVLDMKVIDLLMFSINPGYDYGGGSAVDFGSENYAVGSVDERSALYRRCEAEGVGISVMKPLSGGQLLNGQTSPFGRALTEYQCMQYALDKPGVLAIMAGVRNRADLQKLLGYFGATPEEKDYSVLGTFAPRDAAGKCVYCNHCQPCPAGLDVGIINKYYDLARAGDQLAHGHYAKLEKKAGDCVKCGHCCSKSNLIRAQVSDALMNYVSLLKSRHAEVIWRIYFKLESQTVIARDLNISGTIKG